ncbi:MAG: peptidoglycan-binding domain-containing protein [Methyloligellaceae bacterium]
MKTTKIFAILSLLVFSLVSVSAVSTTSLAKEPVKKAAIKKAKMTKAKAPRVSIYLKAQKALVQQGASLKVDGKWGRKSRSALKAFQKKNGLKANGRLTRATKAKLLGA